MRFRITLNDSRARTSQNLIVTADATATAGDVAAALAAGPTGETAAATPMTLRLSDGAHGRSLAAHTTVLQSGLRSGQTVELVPADVVSTAVSEGRAAAVLRVVSGPDAGVEVQIGIGASTIGRSTSCDVRLTDPMVSKEHARILVGERIELVDAGSSNGVVVGGVRVNSAVLQPGSIAQLGATDITVEPLVTLTANDTTSTDVAFTRSPRVLRRPAPLELEVPEIPKAPNPAPFPLLAMVAPLIMGVVLFAFTRSAMSIVFVAMSPLMMVGSWWTGRRQGAQTLRAERASFAAGLRTVGSQFDQLVGDERECLLVMYPSAEQAVRAMVDRSGLLWSRRPEHPEFLQVRLGLGTIVPAVRLKPFRPQGLPELVDEARQFAAAHSVLTDAPITANLRAAGGLGICGAGSQADGVARAVLCQVAGMHSPGEVVIACLTSLRHRQRWEWLDWLPHCSSASSPLTQHLSADPGTGGALLASLEELIDERITDDDARLRGPGDDADNPRIPSVVVVVDDTTVDRSRLTRVAERGPDAGVFVVWVASDREQLPAACRAFIDVGSDGATSASLVRSEVPDAPVLPETVAAEVALEVGRLLSPVVDDGAVIEDDSNLPRSVPLVSLLGAQDADDPEVVVGRWRENLSLVDRSADPVPRPEGAGLRAFVGHAGSEPFTLDLRAQGPHALVGGTTGAGKSEFLQAWVLGMAHAYSPDRVTFLFVDYKGGSAFARCTDLPHCVGLVTDLSPYLVRRALRSLRAELHHREKLLSEKGKKDLLELEATGDPDCPPSLVIVVDEFAALVGEVPEFVDGVVDVAQRGRSLGLHLILATQRPAGVIRDNLRANTNLRVALRMADEHDSDDVVGAPLAAHFPPSIPGRGIAKLGPGRLTPFQSAFPGSRTPAVAPTPPIDIEQMNFGVRQRWTRPARRESHGSEIAKDIDRVVDTIAAAATRAGVPAPRKPWLASLAELYNLARLPQRRDSEIVLGVRDDPDNQAQPVDYFRPDSQGNILYVGTSGSGKSTALRSLAVAASITPRSGPVHIYGMDFAGSALRVLEDLPTVGSIVSGDDDERIQRLLRTLRDVIDERSVRYAAARASTISDYRKDEGKPDEPRILLLLDGFGTFRTDYEGVVGRDAYYGLFQRLLADGRAVGVHVAMTADRPNSVPSSVGASFQKRIVLRQTDDDAYYALGVARDVLSPTSPPGRAIDGVTGQELQVAILGTSMNLAVQARELEAFGRDLATRHTTRPEPVRALPTTIPAGSLPAVIGTRPVVGIGDALLKPVTFEPVGTLLIAGPGQSGRSNAVAWLAGAASAAMPGARMIHLSARRSPWSARPLWECSATGADEVSEVAAGLLADAALPAAAGRPGLCVVFESFPDFVGGPADAMLTELVKALRRNDHLIIAEGETSGWNSWPLSMEIRNGMTGLLLAPDQQDGDAVLRTSLPRVRRADFPPGRGFWIRAGKATKVQVPLAD